MIATTVGEIAASVGGHPDAVDLKAAVTGPVVVDSRACRLGSLFVCIEGEHTDGHAYVSEAVANGAVAALASRPVDGPAVIVDDPVRALGVVAHDVLRRTTNCRVVGITGSSGKTSTKDLTAAVLSHAGPTVAAVASLNNEIGLPLTVLDVEADTRNLVLEYSARGIGHIAYLCGIARPAIAVVLNVGTAHLGEFGSRDAVATAKGELVEALPADGLAVLGVDDPLVAAMRARTSAQVVGFGTSPAADIRVESLTLDARARPSWQLVTPQGTAPVRLQQSGAHHALNAAAAAAVGLASGMALGDVVEALGNVREISAHRMQLTPRPDGLLVVDDAYNANPESVRAAVDALAVLARGRSGASWAVLGEMRELGADAPELHAAVGRHAAETGVDHLIVVGDRATPIAEGARSVGGWRGSVDLAPDADAATSLVTAGASGDDVVLVKASNALRLWRVADALLDTGRDHASSGAGA